LRQQVDRLHDQTAQANTEKADLEILDPMACEVTHNILISDHIAMNQRKEEEGETAPPQQWGTQQQTGKS